MDKKFENIDELFRSEMSGNLTEAPSHVKGNIDKALGFNKSKKGFLFMGLLLLLSAGGLTAYMMSGDKEALLNSELALVNTETSALPEFEANSLIADDHEGMKDNLTSPMQDEMDASNSSNAVTNKLNSLTNTSPSNPTNKIISGNTLNKNNQVNTNNSRLDLERSASQSNPSVHDEINQSNNGVSSNSDVLTESNLPVNSTENLEKDVDITIESSEKSQSNISANINSNTQNNDRVEDTNSTNGTEEKNNSEAKEDDSAEKNETIIESSEENNEDEDAITSDESGNQTQTETENLNQVTSDELGDMPPEALAEIDPLKKSTYKPWTVSLTSGINFVKSAYSSKDMMEKTVYDNATDDKVGNQTNLDISYRLKKGLAFGTGIGFVNYNENYDFPTYGVIKDSIESVEFVYDSMGTVIDSVFSYSISETQYEKRSTGQNRASYVMLPVHFGTQILWKKFQFDLFASARFNFLVRSSGAYLMDNNLNGFHKENSIYKPFYVDVMLGGNMHYQLWKNLYVTGTVKYRPVIGSTLQSVSFNKSFDYIHLGMGLSLKF